MGNKFDQLLDDNGVTKIDTTIRNNDVYVKIRFDDKSRKHPYVVRVSEKSSDNYSGWDQGIFEGHLELRYGNRPEGCELGADAIGIDSGSSRDYTYHPTETKDNTDINKYYLSGNSDSQAIKDVFPRGLSIHRVSDGKEIWGFKDEVAEAQRAAWYKEALINSRMNEK